MTQELRIRDSYSSQVRSSGHGEPPGAPNAHFLDPGETAWDLAESPSAPTAGPVESAERSQSRDDALLPFVGFPGMGDDEEEPPKGPGLDLERFARGIIKRFWLMLGVALIIASLFLVAALTRVKPKWQAVAVVMSYTHRDQFSLGGAKPFETENYNLKTLLDTIRLPSSLQAVADALKLTDPPERLGPSIAFTVVKDSNIFQITAVWNDPVVAANIANQFAKLLVQQSQGMRHKDAMDAHANYSEQLESARNNLRAITAEARSFKASHQVTDFDTEIQVLLGSLSGLESEFSTRVAEVQAYKDVLAEVEKAIKDEPEMIVSSTIYRNPLKTRLSEYEWGLQEARSRYTEQNPKVIKLKSRVDVLKQMIAESKDEGGAPENFYSANTKLTELRAQQSQLSSDIRVREAQMGALAKTIEQNRTKLAALAAAERDFKLLKARMASAENLVTGLVRRVDEAEVVIRRDEAGVELIEPARPPIYPLPSPKKTIAMMGVALGGGVGLGLALLLELLDPRLRTRRDALGIPGIALAWEFQHVPSGERLVVAPHRCAAAIAVHFRRLVNELNANLEPDAWRCMGVTSADPETGRTLVATNLAKALALKEQPVILVDADLGQRGGMRPSGLLGLSPDQPGLLQALRGEAPVASLVMVTATPDLAYLAAGCSRYDRTPEPSVRASFDAAPSSIAEREPDLEQDPDHHLAGLGSRQFIAILDTLRQTGRNVVYDLPALGDQEVALEAAASLGSLLLVARSGQTTRKQLREAVGRLEERGAKVLGILVTDVPYELLDGKPLFHPEPKQPVWLRWARRFRPQAQSS
ncbi:tyrosine-protein kinase domain-containing protein [uncultured Lamprocystis sp.]|uniref:GumC family protein n=1 Tax=uncultured Lamprocystis sp. TaxID=543132 RepID=UPI0025FD5DE9|nr:tyrosine-protein kinase domain-containing protein [uncultured Lamprocystis sp.]